MRLVIEITGRENAYLKGLGDSEVVEVLRNEIMEKIELAVSRGDKASLYDGNGNVIGVVKNGQEE